MPRNDAIINSPFLNKVESLTYEELHRQLDYNPLTGIFIWKISKSGIMKKGAVAGTTNDGYIIIMVNGKSYKAHRLAWFYEKGYMPENMIGHKDRIRHHNWIDNLRGVSNQCNQRNTGNSKVNTSGVKGVVWNKNTGKWTASVYINRKQKFLGRYKDFSEAACTRLAVEQCVNWEGCGSCRPAFKYVKENIQ